MDLAHADRRIARAQPGAPPSAAAHAIGSAKLPVPVALYLLTVVLPIEFNAGPLAMSTLRLLLILLVLPLLGQLLMGRFGRIQAADILFFLHIVWATIALSVNNPDQVVQQIGSVGVEFIGGYLVGRAYIRNAETFIALCRWLVFLVLCTAPFAIYEAKSGRSVILELLDKLPGFGTVAIITMEGRMGMERVQSVFAHPIHYGLFCSVAYSLAFVAMRDITSTGWRYFSSAIVGLCGFLALSSGALLAIFLQTALILWSSIFARIRWRWWLLVGHFCVAYVVVDALSNRAPLQVFMSYATFSPHNAYWRSIIFEWGMKNLWGSPVFGIGLNDWVRPWYMYSGSMDNFWLVMAVRYGIPGFLLLAAGYAWTIFLVMRRNFDGSLVLTRIRRAWVFTFLGLSFTLTTVHVWTNIYSFVFFMFGAGMWLIYAEAPGGGADTGPQPRTARAAPARPQRGEGPAASDTVVAPAPSQNRLIYSRFAPRQTRTPPPADPSD